MTSSQFPPPLRIVSLLPSSTEIVCALGLQDHLVGISHCCDFPSEIKHLPVLTKSAIDPSLPSAEIDRLTKEALASGGGLYQLDEDLLDILQPNIIITQALCDVCAISFTSVARAVGQLQNKAQLISLEPDCIEAIFTDVRNVAQATGTVQAAERVIQQGKARLARLKQQVSDVPRRRVLALEWFDPLYYGGHWVPEQIEHAGGESVMGKAHARSEGFDWDTLIESDPDVIVCMPCGYDTKHTAHLLTQLQHKAEWQALRAVRGGDVWAVDANSYFSRPSPRVVTGAELLGHILHPDRVDLPEGVETPIRLTSI